MSTLSSALTAMDKATPGEWELVVGTGDTLPCIASKDGVCVADLGSVIDPEIAANAKVIKASKLALAFIKEAVEYLYEYRPYLVEQVEAWKGRTRGDNYAADLIALDALIARAKE